MSLSQQQGSSSQASSSDEQVIRPGTIVLTLLLMGISTLFLGMIAAYCYSLFTSGNPAPRPPILFLVNIPVLFLATFFIRKAGYAFGHAQFSTTQQQLLACLVLTFVFGTLQVIGWVSFFRQIPFTASQPRSYLFVLSGLHLLHILAGIPFMIWLIFNTAFPDRRTLREMDWWQGFLRGLIRYWNYLDMLWIVLVVVLWGGYLINFLH